MVAERVWIVTVGGGIAATPNGRLMVYEKEVDARRAAQGNSPYVVVEGYLMEALAK